MEQSYDISKTYQENYERGPRLSELLEPVPDTPEKVLFGFPVRSRLGIAAGLLLNSKWIKAYAQRGFDLLTYKTVRSSYRPCYPLPNWVFVDEEKGVAEPVRVRDEPPQDPEQVSSAVCFGMPSMAPEIWRSDVSRARLTIGQGQVLLVSVVATPRDGWGMMEIADDFACCAAWAAEAGADVVEANFSCPNVCTAEGSIYLDPKLSRDICRVVRERIGTTPLVLKVGYFSDDDLLRAFLESVAPWVDGITLVNGMTRAVLRRDGQPVFGEAYTRAGVLGRSIHNASVRSVASARRHVDREKLSLSLLAVGGASVVPDIEDFFDIGADAVLMGSSPMYQPSLSIEAKKAHPEW